MISSSSMTFALCVLSLTLTNLMDKNLTEIVYILDRSGSMSGLEADTIGAFLDRGEWGKVIKKDFEKRAKKRR